MVGTPAPLVLGFEINLGYRVLQQNMGITTKSSDLTRCSSDLRNIGCSSLKFVILALLPFDPSHLQGSAASKRWKFDLRGECEIHQRPPSFAVPKAKNPELRQWTPTILFHVSWWSWNIWNSCLHQTSNPSRISRFRFLLSLFTCSVCGLGMPPGNTPTLSTFLLGTFAHPAPKRKGELWFWNKTGVQLSNHRCLFRTLPWKSRNCRHSQSWTCQILIFLRQKSEILRQRWANSPDLWGFEHHKIPKAIWPTFACTVTALSCARGVLTCVQECAGFFVPLTKA